MTAPREGTLFAAARWVGAVSIAGHAALWAVMVLATVVVFAGPPFPVAVRHPLLAMAIAATCTVVGLALAQLGTLRFIVFGRLLDLFAGLGFGALALGTLLPSLLGSLAFAELADTQSSGYVRLAMEVAAGLLFLLGLARPARATPLLRRRELAWRIGTSATLGVLAVAGVLVTSDDALPGLVAGPSRDALAAGIPILAALPGQSPVQLMGTGLAAVLFLVVSVGYVGVWLRLHDPQLGWLAAALTMLFFEQVHRLLFPAVAVEYVATADAFRLAAYLTLLFSLVTRLSGEIAERAAREERLRLSRELHDGLAQQLSLLNIRLNRAASPGRTAAQRAQDLETAMRLVESASLEARQAITALRTGTVTWGDLVRTVDSFVDEFGANHEVETRVESDDGGGNAGRFVIQAEVQAEVLRIIHEALSNALRHGGARHIQTRLLARSPSVLQLEVQDDGSGFQPKPALAGTGVGLRSMSERIEARGGTLLLESAPGRGTTVRALLPLAPRRA